MCGCKEEIQLNNEYILKKGNIWQKEIILSLTL